MSSCHFPHDSFTIILDHPSFTHLNHSLKLIETNLLIPMQHSLFSMTSLDKPSQPTHHLLQQEEDSLGQALHNSSAEEGEISSLVKEQLEGSNREEVRRKKGGCTCKKTNCIKMYCECFSVGKMCTPDCSCFGCFNHQAHQPLLERAKLNVRTKQQGANRHSQPSCNCKKTNCQKKYCECFNAGVGCGSACRCSGCCNPSSRSQMSSPILE